MEQIFLDKKTTREMLAMKWPIRNERRRVSDETLRMALQGRVNSPVAKMLRAAAMQRGGAVAQEYVPQCECTVDHNHGVWTFVFLGVVVLTWHKNVERAEITIGGSKGAMEYREIRTIDQLMELQRIAEEIAKEQRELVVNG